MIKDASVAARYARALQLLLEKQAAKAGRPPLASLEQALAELDGLVGIVAPGTRAGRFLLDPQVNPADRRAALANALEGRVSPGVRVFADLLLRKKRLSLIRAIAHEFQVIVERVQGLEHATAVSAVPLTDAEHHRLHAELERYTGKKIVLELQVDVTLVGGAYVRIGDRVIDRSIRSLLESLSRQLYEVSV